MRMLDEPPFTWNEWKKQNIVNQQFDRNKFIAISLTKNDSKTKDLINDFVDNILSVSKPIKITLFGSRSRNDFNKNSDIDICVIFKKKSDITRKYYTMIDTLIKTSPVDVDFKTASIHYIKNHQHNMNEFYYYVMRESIILYQRDDNGLYELLEKTRYHLNSSYRDSKSKTTSGFISYITVKWSLNSIFLASYIPIPPFKHITNKIPNDWKINYTNEEIKYITKLVRPIVDIDGDKNPLKSYHIARKIYKSVLNNCIKKDLLTPKQISKLQWIL